MRPSLAFAAIAIVALAAPARAGNAGAGWNPRSFTDSDEVTGVYQYTPTKDMKGVVATLSIASSSDGGKTWSLVIPKVTEKRDLVAGKVAEFVTEAIPQLGKKAAGANKLRIMGELSLDIDPVEPSLIHDSRAVSVITKTCTKAGNLPQDVVKCQWKAFNPAHQGSSP